MNMRYKVLAVAFGLCVASLVYAKPFERQVYTYYDANGVVVGYAYSGCDDPNWIYEGQQTAISTYSTEDCWVPPPGNSVEGDSGCDIAYC